ncbi:MAG: DUF4271 domain-containing protein [Bacteroidota bacterium]
MRLGCLVVLFLLVGAWAVAQNSSNPFELAPRLTPEAESTAIPTTDETEATNPFDISSPADEATALEAVAPPANQNPFDITSEEEASEEVETVAPGGEGEDDANNTQLEEAPIDLAASSGIRLGIALLILVFTAACLLFFRGLYSKCYRALFNDNLLSQLYREREAGALGSFLIMYLVFFIGGGFFVALAGQHLEFFPTGELWRYTWYSMLGLLGLLIFKHILLVMLGYIFPLAKEASRYSFTIMVFSIIGGLVLSLGSLLLAYAPEGAEGILIWGCSGLLVLLYLLRSLRGFFIANRFIFNSQFHFLSYICAVEIGPALCFLKLLTDF